MRHIVFAAALALAGAGAARADWTATPDSTGVGGNVGQLYSWDCPGGGAFGPIWGSGLYTSDSSLCTAAVHGGHITQARGGQITFAILPGAESYVGSSANGVTTGDYGPWGRSFQIVGAMAAARTPPPAPRQITWQSRMMDMGVHGDVGSVHAYVCPPGGTTSGPLWGTGVYTSDSAICLAAVHAGRISAASGGLVTVQVTGSNASYAGTSNNGVTSNGYGAWDSSFTFR